MPAIPHFTVLVFNNRRPKLVQKHSSNHICNTISTLPHSPPPPRAHVQVDKLGDWCGLFDSLVDFGEVRQGGSVWELDYGELKKAKMERVGELSQNGAFGRCLVYRVDISRLPQASRVVER